MSADIALSANTLFHFTNSASNLINILSNGFTPRFCLEPFGSNHIVFTSEEIASGKVHNEEAIPMTCFCDLPISHISSHLEFYGSYGIGLSKEWGIKNGLTPLSYIHENSTQLKYLNKIAKAVYRNDYKGPDTLKPDDSTILLMELGGYFKPYEGKMWRNDKYVKKRFYDEREWRYIPFIIPGEKTEFDKSKKIDYRLSKDEYLNEIKRAKSDKYIAESFTLEFKFDDIKYIIIKNDNEAEAMTDSINSDSRFTKTQKNILYTKIISTEQINEDF